MSDYEARCRKAFEQFCEEVTTGIYRRYRVSVVFQDGGAFSKDFYTEAEAVRVVNANVSFGSSILVAAFMSTKAGWREVYRYPEPN